jgi:hypothetical protein
LPVFKHSYAIRAASSYPIRGFNTIASPGLRMTFTQLMDTVMVSSTLVPYCTIESNNQRQVQRMLLLK